MKKLILVCLMIGAISPFVVADENSGQALHKVQQQWAHINYELEGDEKSKAFEALIKEGEALVKANPSAESLIWLGIVQSSTAGAEGGLGALKYAKAAKKNFEQAIALDKNALQGSAMTSLGVLYHKVPGWPISFGSDKKAQQHLMQALQVNPDGIDPNYFYAEYLYDEGEYNLAKSYINAAKNAPARPDRPLADKGRQQEIARLMKQINAKL